MKKKYSFILLFFFCVIASGIFGQQKKQTQELPPDFAVLSFVKKQEVLLRWAPAKFELWKNANQYGYKIERYVKAEQKDNTFDTSASKILLNNVPLKPWPLNDEQWKSLIQKNKNASLLYNLLYKTGAQANTAGKEIVLGMVLKSFDLYPEIAKAGGLFLRDSSINSGESYVYRISLWNAPKTLKYTPLTSDINTKQISTLSQIKPIKVKFGNKRAVISVVTAAMEDYYSGFWIERSGDSTNFISINRSPLIHSTTKYDEGKTESIYPDSLPENDKIFYYRVRGISYFGELSQPSNIVSGKGKIDFTAYPFIDSTIILNNKSVKLKFKMPADFNTKQLKGFFIMRCETKNGKYVSLNQNLIEASVTDFTDKNPIATNYYRIGAVNINNDSTLSFTTFAKLIDDIPPAAPCWLPGKIDSSGTVTLTWEANKEIDLLGYRVFRCNNEKEQPVELTKTIITETKFTDKITLHTLTREIFYTIRAIDKVYNNSAYSDLCKINKPDKIAPVPPLFKQTVHTDSSIQLNWLLSTSDDAVLYKLLKVDQHENGWKVLKEWKAKDSLKNYIDTAIQMESRYKYRLEVYDEAKNNSFTNSPSVLFRPAFAPAVKFSKANINREKRNIELHWNYSIADVYTYSIYKAKGDEPMRIWKTIEGKITSCTDTELYPNNVYNYSVKAILKSGIESKTSKVLEVIF